ncbi:MAG: CHAT domain-containing protein, partial [Candidatus Eisenbacteria bacterium]|nr:CHAT domain-containing protein [Candidatus Eisenbacteria bacterium]
MSIARRSLAVVPWLLWCLAALPAAGAAVSDSLTVALDEIDHQQLDRKWALSDSLATRVFERASRLIPPDSVAMSRALDLRAGALLGQARLRDGVGAALLERSLAIRRRLFTPDTARWVAACNLLGRVRMEQDLPDSALAAFAAARRLCSPTLAASDSFAADAWFMTGRVHRRKLESDSALAALGRSRVLRERRFGPRHPQVAQVLSEVGANQLFGGRYEEARSSFETAIEMIVEARDPTSSELVQPLGQLANLQYQVGDIAGSIETLERTIAIQSKLDNPNSARLIPQRFNLAMRFFDFGDFRSVTAKLEPLLSVADAAFGPTHTRTRQILVMLGASTLMSGDLVAARGYLSRVRPMYADRAPDPTRMEVFVDRFYAALLAREGDLPNARLVSDSLMHKLRAEPAPIWLSMHALESRLEIAMAQGDRNCTADVVARMDSLFTSEAERPSTNFASYRRLKGRAFAWLGRPEAWDEALAAEELERARVIRNVRALADRQALQLAGGLAEPFDQLALLARSGDSSRVATAWDRLVRWRGLVGSEIAARRPPRGADADPVLLASHAQWEAARRHQAQFEVAALASGASPEASAKLAIIRTEAQDAERRYAALADARGLQRDTAQVSLARIRAALAPGAALVSIVELAPETDTARVVAFVATGASSPSRLLDLGLRRELRPRLEAWRAALASPPPAGHEREAERACRRLGEAVRERTWDRLAPAFGDAYSILVVADGDLADLPWSALPEAGNRYLVEIGPVIDTPGAERELIAHAWPMGAGLLAVGDPDFGRASPLPDPAAATALAMRGSLGKCLAASSLELQPLPGARREVEDVSAAWLASHPADAPMSSYGASASERAIKAAAPGRRVLHFATHGVVWGDSCSVLRAGMRGVGGVT